MMNERWEKEKEPESVLAYMYMQAVKERLKVAGRR